MNLILKNDRYFYILYVCNLAKVHKLGGGHENQKMCMVFKKSLKFEKENYNV